MSKDDLLARVQKQPALGQSNALSGIYKGIVVDVKDPVQLGRVRVYSYPIHGDMKLLEIDALPWCTFVKPFRGSHCAAELNDRVVISFEASNKYAPVVLGYWDAIPMGRGTVPYSIREGTDVRPEAWHHHGLYPEVNILGCSGAGNAFWFEDKLVGDNLASVIQMEDTGGKVIRAKSYHLGYEGFASIQEYTGKPGGMLEGGAENKPARDGLTVAPAVAGVIEIANQNIVRTLLTGKETFSADQMLQLNTDGEFGIVQESVCGEIHKTRQGIASLSLSNDMASLMGRCVVAMPFYTPPRIW